MFMLYYKSEIRMFVCVVNRREGRGGGGGEVGIAYTENRKQYRQTSLDKPKPNPDHNDS